MPEATNPITTASNPRVGEDVGCKLEDLAAAIDAADQGYSITLTSLTEAGSVYTLDLCDGSDPVKFADRDDAREHAERHRSLARAKAALAFLSARNGEAQ